MAPAQGRRRGYAKSPAAVTRWRRLPVFLNRAGHDKTLETKGATGTPASLPVRIADRPRATAKNPHFHTTRLS